MHARSARMVVIICFLLLGLTVMLSRSAVQASGPVVGQVTLHYSSGDKTVYIQDISPDIGSTAQDEAGHYANRWGLMGALSASGVQQGSSPATAYLSSNAGATVEHVAAASSDGHVITWYYSNSNDWKHADVTEKTGIAAAVEAPTSWTAQAGAVLLENLAARDAQGNVFAFTWQAGADWTATNLTSQPGPYSSASPLTSWNAAAGTSTAQHIAFRTPDNDLVLYWRLDAGGWAPVNVSAKTGNQKIAGTPDGWNMTSQTSIERVAVTDSSNHLILFTFTPATDWYATDVTAAANNQLVAGRVSAWDRNGDQYIAAHTPDDKLVVFKLAAGPDHVWSVTDVTGATGGVSIATDPIAWNTVWRYYDVTLWYEHVAAPDPSGHIQHFVRIAGGTSWTAEDVTNATNVSVNNSYRLAAWLLAPLQFLAAPTGDGRMHVFSEAFIGSSWSALDISARSAGRVVYAASPNAGVWTSRDYGASWRQSSRDQPAPAFADAQVAGAFNSPRINDVAVSPQNLNLAIAAADTEGRTSQDTGGGVYRTSDGGNTWQRVYQFNCPWGTEGATQVLIAPDDPQRVYAAGGCAIARSTSGGAVGSWQPLTATVTMTGVWHLAVSGKTGSGNTDRELVACGDGQLWASPDDGGTWRKDPEASARLPQGFCGKTNPLYTPAHVLALVLSQPSLVYLAMSGNANGPSYYHPKSKGGGPDGTYCNSPVVYHANLNTNTYEAADTLLRGFPPVLGRALGSDQHLKYYDAKGSGHYDPGDPVVYDVNLNGIYDINQNGVDKDGEDVLSGAPQPQNNALLASDPHLKVVDLGQPFGDRGCGEASLWLGDVSNVLQSTGNQHGTWSQLPGPPVFWGAGSNSGSAFVYTQPLKQGYLVLFADDDTVNVSVGPPTTAGWHRLDGTDASANHRLPPPDKDKNHDYIHSDPRGLAFSADLSLTLKPVTDPAAPYPYNQNSELDQCGGGRLWIANDGGMSASDDCGASEARWQSAYTGLHVLNLANIAGVTKGDLRPSLYFGVAHNDAFYSMNDGDTWNAPIGARGDCGGWAADLYQLNRVLRLERSNSFGVFTNTAYLKPDPGSPAGYHSVPYPDGVPPYGRSDVFHLNRPVIQSMPAEALPADGDTIVLRERGANEHYLLRANGSLLTQTLTLDGGQIPPSSTPLPIDQWTFHRRLWVQASGGHTNTAFYVGDGISLWRGGNPPNKWDLIVPGGGVQEAWRFFVNPYDPTMLYLMNGTGVYSSTNSGGNWNFDQNLSTALSDNGRWQWINTNDARCCTLADMVFDPTMPNRRFAAGPAGVFFTADAVHWFRLLDTRALPSLPVGLWFDPISQPNDNALYVATDGRGILKLHPIPRTPPDPLPPLPPPAPTPIPTPLPPLTGTGELLTVDGGFEQGWKYWTPIGAAAIITGFSYGGSASLRLGGVPNSTDGAAQTVSIPCDARQVRLSYAWFVASQNSLPIADTFQTSVDAVTLQTLTSYDSDMVWEQSLYDLSGYACRSVTVSFHSRENEEGATAFYVSAVQLTAYNGQYRMRLPLLAR